MVIAWLCRHKPITSCRLPRGYAGNKCQVIGDRSYVHEPDLIFLGQVILGSSDPGSLDPRKFHEPGPDDLFDIQLPSLHGDFEVGKIICSVAHESRNRQK